MRIRTVRPEFFVDEELALVPIAARLLFIGLFCIADRRGRLEYRPMRIRAQVFPYEPQVEVEPLLQALVQGRFLIRYQVKEKDLLQIRTFEKHQRITGTEAASESEFPAPSKETLWKQHGNTREAPRKQRRSKREASGKHAGSDGEAAGKQPGNTLDDWKGKERKGKDVQERNGEYPPTPLGGEAGEEQEQTQPQGQLADRVAGSADGDGVSGGAAEPGGAAAPAAKRKRRAGVMFLPELPEAVRERAGAIAEILRRRPGTGWQADEVEAVRLARLTELPAAEWEEQVGLVREYHAMPADPQGDFRRRSVLTLVRHWSEEVDKARRALEARKLERERRLKELDPAGISQAAGWQA
jgi:hypothetical protein